MLILWTHALAALLFGALALWQVSRAATALPRLAFLIALTTTSLWALAIAGIGADDIVSRVAQSVRNLAWLAFMVALVRRDRRVPAAAAVTAVYVIAVLMIVAGIAVALVANAFAERPEAAGIAQVGMLLRMLVAVTALVLVNHLYSAVRPDARGGIRLAVFALAGMWMLDLGVYTLGYLDAVPTSLLVLLRGTAMIAVAPLFGLAAHRNGDWTLNLSRTVTYQSLSLVGVMAYLLMMAIATSGLGAIGGVNARLWQTAFVFGSTTALVTIFSSPWLRGWLKVKLAKHLFSHRYDYRAEWQRFTDTLGKPNDGGAPLEERIVKAVAELTDSPSGMLLVPDGNALGPGACWHWEGHPVATQGVDAALVRHLEATGRIVELDAVRAGTAEAAELAGVPVWMADFGDGWVLAPLVHFGKLVGAVLLTRPPVDRRPDWEDLDLLRIAGRQAASYLAEARAHDALSDAQRFDEFNRRFAFIMHDIKNLVSQLSLVARNAERHADNPDFRADMVATLKDSAARMNDLLARLSQHHSPRPEAVETMEVVPLIERVAALRRSQHPVVTGGMRDALINADPVRVEQLLNHLVQNAIDASPPAEPVSVMVHHSNGDVAIDIVDHGSGMSPGFVRDKLFKPFVSSKSGGFGLGAFEARQLAEAMGGRVDVFSREGEGTRMRVTLPGTVAPAEPARRVA